MKACLGLCTADHWNVGTCEKQCIAATAAQVSGVHKSMPATVTYKPDSPSSTEQQVGLVT